MWITFSRVRQLLSYISISFASAAILSANVTLPKVIADHMVIQRELPVHIWGNAAPGETVTVSFRGAHQSTNADDLGRWSVYLPPGPAGGPFPLVIAGNNTISFNDVLVGDVWVASGQSNMEFVLRNADHATEEIASANNDHIRLFHVERNVSDYPLADIDARTWVPCTSQSAPAFSAVAYFFGRHLQQKLNIPIGLIESSWGGTPAEAWTSLHALSADASLMPVFRQWSQMSDGYLTTQLERAKEQREHDQEVAKAKAEHREPKPLSWHPNERRSWSPAGLFNAMIAPITPFPIRGVIWYQGESNADSERAPLYGRLFQTMIRDWRRAWGVGEFPFLFVQIANFKTGPNSDWPTVRDAQRQTLSLKNTGMAVTIDIGNPTNIHPTDKQDVGLRLALAARAISYGEKIEYSGPRFRQLTIEGHALRVWFDHANGLNAKNGPLKGFEIAGADGKFVSAEAHIDGSTVAVASSSVAEPVAVRYGWADNPDCNLYNGDGLPASPFQSGE